MRYDFQPVAACNMCGSSDRRQLGLRMNKSQGLRPKQVSGIAVSVMQCRRCELIYADPLPRPESLSNHYDLPPESYWRSVPKWDPTYFAGEIKAAKRLLPFTPGMRALDIGAGLGNAMRSLEAGGFEAFGMEPSAPFHAHALTNNGIEPSRLQLSSIEDAAYEADTFDFITFGAVLEHLYDPDAALRRAVGWLKPGGIIHAEVPSSRHLVARFLNAFFRLRGTNFVTHISPMHSPFHLYEFGLRSFALNGERNGYDIAEQRIEVCEIMHLPRPLHPALRWWMRQRQSGMQLIVYLRKPSR